MLKRLRSYLLPATAAVAVAALAVAAAAAPRALDESVDEEITTTASPDPDLDVDENPAEDPVDEGEDPAEEVEEEPLDEEPVSEEDVESHGACVSTWAHNATEAGLRGAARGHFVASVAHDKEAVGTDCDKQAELDAALAEQTQPTSEEEGVAPGEEAKKTDSHGKGRSGEAPRSGR